VDPRVGLEAVEKRKKSCHAGNRTRVVQPVAIPSELSRLVLVFGMLTSFFNSIVSEKPVVEAHACPLSTPSTSTDAHMHLCWITVAEGSEKRTALEQTRRILAGSSAFCCVVLSGIVAFRFAVASPKNSYRNTKWSYCFVVL
jgi:hypothetical protein